MRNYGLASYLAQIKSAERERKKTENVVEIEQQSTNEFCAALHLRYYITLVLLHMTNSKNRVTSHKIGSSNRKNKYVTSHESNRHFHSNSLYTKAVEVYHTRAHPPSSTSPPFLPPHPSLRVNNSYSRIHAHTYINVSTKNNTNPIRVAPVVTNSARHVD